MKKKYIGMALLVILAGSALVGCAGNKNENQNQDTKSNVQSEVSSNVEPEKIEEQQNVAVQDDKKDIESNKNSENNKSEDKKKNNKKNDNKDVKPEEYKKLSGKFVCIDSSIFNKVPADKKDLFKKELQRAILKFNDDGTVFSGVVMKDGKEQGMSGKFNQTKDKLMMTYGDNENKEEANYTFDGKILKITDSKTNITLTFEKR